MGRRQVVFNFFKRRPRPELISSEVHINTLARWFSYDSAIHDPAELGKILSLLPVSAEGEDQEMMESAKRVGRISALFPFMSVLSDINAQAVAGMQMKVLIDNGFDPSEVEAEREKIQDMYTNISFSALMATLAAGVELGIISTDAVDGRIKHEFN